MRLTEIALAITLVLLAITAYLAYEGHRDRFTSDEDPRARPGHGGAGSVEQRLAAIEQQVTAMRQDQGRLGEPVRVTPPVGGETPQAGATPAPATGSDPVDDALAAMIESGAIPRPPAIVEQQPAEPQLTELERQVLRAPVFARVDYYDADYNVLQISAGSDRGVREGVEFSIRRGQYLLGTMRVMDVEEAAAAGEMILSTMPDGLVVEPGDEVIQKIGGAY